MGHRQPDDHHIMASATVNETAGKDKTAMADFFSPDVIKLVLHNPTTAHRLKEFCQSTACAENMEFLDKVSLSMEHMSEPILIPQSRGLCLVLRCIYEASTVDTSSRSCLTSKALIRTTLINTFQIQQYNQLLTQASDLLAEIQAEFLTAGSPEQVNLPDSLLRSTISNIASTRESSIPTISSLMDPARDHIESLIAEDIYPRFVMRQIMISAKAGLSTNKSQYQGLGDCFCLTEPS